MSVVLPSLTTFDPETSSEGALDPLGLYLIADQLATRLVPAVRERMQRIRFLTAMAVGAIVTEEFEPSSVEESCAPWLVWEWLVVESLLRSPTIASELRGVPGTLVTKRALNSHKYLDDKSYLKTPRIFGFHGVYKRLAIHLGLVDVHMKPQAGAEELVLAWAHDQGWTNLRDANPVLDAWRTGVRRSLEAKPPRTHTYWNGDAWEQLAQSLKPDGAGKRERKVLSRLLLNTDHRALGALGDIWGLQESMDDESYCEEKMVEELKNRAPSLLPLLDAISFYEAFCRKLSDGFNVIRTEAAKADIRGLTVTDLGSDQAFESSAANLTDAFEAAYTSLQVIDNGLASQFDERFQRFSGLMPVEEVSIALCEHHEAIQKGKNDSGKRTWFDRLGGDRIYLRHQYRENVPGPQPDRLVHAYRGRPIRNFYKDLR
ncbi:hypothetical protein [Aureliella helgolandensis]|uniref:Uncharacterized protein n=1 Tax=Aureliella helgolandensis TaxID=2527968 RepID=A0A518G9P8_9BACT|nr:hypothetical protein [Aureliella helgolandensis]QDV25302.1 hypothetical protein Q31a_36260 [Aureliella helgolandensis]